MGMKSRKKPTLRDDLRAAVAASLAGIIYGPGIEMSEKEGDEEMVRKGKEEAVRFAKGLVKK